MRAARFRELPRVRASRGKGGEKFLPLLYRATTLCRKAAISRLLHILRRPFFGAEDKPLGLVNYHEFARVAEKAAKNFFRYYIERRRFAAKRQSLVFCISCDVPFLVQKISRSVW